MTKCCAGTGDIVSGTINAINRSTLTGNGNDLPLTLTLPSYFSTVSLPLVSLFPCFFQFLLLLTFLSSLCFILPSSYETLIFPSDTKFFTHVFLFSLSLAVVSLLSSFDTLCVVALGLDIMPLFQFLLFTGKANLNEIIRIRINNRQFIINEVSLIATIYQMLD